MKKDIHPQYYENAQIKCACGNVITTGSTKEKIEVEICSKCHPFFAGGEKLVDIAGRVEKFKERAKKSQQIKSERSKIVSKTTLKTKSKTKK